MRIGNNKRVYRAVLSIIVFMAILSPGQCFLQANVGYHHMEVTMDESNVRWKFKCYKGKVFKRAFDTTKQKYITDWIPVD